jgi:PAS domain S-box-containing protein
VHVPQPAQLEPLGFAESSSAALRLALASSSDMVLELHRDGTLADANQSACDWLGLSRGEIRGRTLASIDVGATPERIEHMFAELVAGRSWRVEARYRIANGGALPVDVIAQRAEVDGREFFFLFAREIVEHKRIEAALAQSAEHFRSLFEDSPIAELLLDTNFRIVQVNRAACALLGYASGELIGRDPALLLHPDEIEAGLRLRTHLARGAVVSAESDRRMVRSDGRTVWVRLTVRAWAIGEATRRYVLVLEDFSDRRAASEHLEQALQHSRMLLETMSVGVAQALDGKVMLANREFARLFGYTEAETLGLPLDELTRDRANRLPQEVSMLPAARAGESSNTEVVLFRKDGAPVWCLVQARVVDAGEADGASAHELGTDAIYTFLDVSELKHQREALGRSLLELNVVLDTTAAAVLHLADGRIVRGNAQSAAIFGGDASGPVGLAFGELFADPPAPGENWRQRIADPQAAQTFEARMRRADGKSFWALVSLRAVDPLRPGDAQIASILDISERRRQEEKLHSLASETQLLFDTAVVGLLFVRDGRPVRANAAMEEMLGCERGELTRGGDVFAHPADSLLMSSLAEHYGEIDQRGACDFELRLYRRRGSPGWVAVQGRAVDTRTEGAGYIFAFVDIDARKRSEAELRDALAELQRIFDNALVGVAYAANDMLVKVNAATVQMFGYRIDELKQLNIGALFADAAEWDDARVRAAAAGEVNFERQLKRADGSTFWGAGNVRLLDTGAPERGMIVALMNVDARKRSEDELRRVRNYLDLIVESLPVLVSVREADSGRFISLNRAGEAITGLSRDSVIGRTWHDLYGAVLAENFAQLDRAALDGDHLIDRARDVLPRADGRTLTVHQRVMPLYEDGADDIEGRAPGQRAQYVMSIIDDLTDTVRAEAALRETDARFRQLAENIDQMVFIATDDFARVLYVSPRYTALVGAPAAEALDDVRNFYQHVHPADVPELTRRLPRLIASMRRGRRAEVTLRVDHPEQGTRTLHVRLSPVRMFDGSIRVFGIAEDITLRMAAEAKRLDEAVKQRDLLVREVHHRIKNNLQGVAGLLQHQANAKPELAETLNEIAGQIQAIAQVHGLQLRATGTLPMLGVVQGIFSNLGGMFGAAVNFESPAPVLWRWGLPEHEAVPLALVINELGTNAIKYRTSRDQGIAVRLLPRADGIELRIENSGHLAEGFDLARITSGVSGLGLVKALLPRRGARLSIEQLGPIVISRLVLSTPAIREEPA